MLTEVNNAARFLPKRGFHVDPKISVSAPVTAGYLRQGDGSQVSSPRSRRGVKYQLDDSLVNSHQLDEIIGEQKVRLEM